MKDESYNFNIVPDTTSAPVCRRIVITRTRSPSDINQMRLVSFQSEMRELPAEQAGVICFHDIVSEGQVIRILRSH